ncbi:hypothetical protein CAEBREN_15720 [Caenorhabditis brenneri]|uniref:Seven TM Receptor n=1 Tax=Caenorhabditis brenneri TaxID=135651 RepID=G0PEM9_CAEBE|nr:hypothetical protein CAEBREN_15720 [Caenorhabditis brenneri]
MVIYFAATGIFFSAFELVARPFAHNYTGALMFFSLNTDQRFIILSQLAIAIWSGFFTSIISFISIQFFYRCLCLFGGEAARKFDRLPSIIWMGYPLVIASMYAASVYFFCQPDEDSDEYLRNEILRNYNMDIKTIPRFIMRPYDINGDLRWRNIGYFATGLFLIGFHYLVIIYCGLIMHFNMKHELEKFSIPQRKIQRQIFKALILQCMGPTLFLILPAVPLLMSPLIPPSLHIQISWQTGWLYSLIQIFPPFDSIAFMIVVVEYRRVIKKQFSRGTPKNSSIHPSGTGLENDISHIM